MVVHEHQGEVPRTAEALQTIKGIGPYTAGAVASIAFDQPSPVVDGNVVRVFSRLHAMPGDPASLMQPCWALAARILDQGRPGAFNQALMELGATVCTPRAAACTTCPLRNVCRARRAVQDGVLESVLEFPAKVRRVRHASIHSGSRETIRWGRALTSRG